MVNLNVNLSDAANVLWRYSGLNYAKNAVFGSGAKGKFVCSHCKHSTSATTLSNMNLGICRSNFVRLAGVSGAIAVGLGAYGAHVFSKKEIPQELKQVYDTANFYHFIHTLALLGIPLTRRPLISGTLISVGMLLFCGSCYYHALTGSKEIRMVTPYGGVLLMIGWISIVL